MQKSWEGTDFINKLNNINDLYIKNKTILNLELAEPVQKVNRPAIPTTSAPKKPGFEYIYKLILAYLLSAFLGLFLLSFVQVKIYFIATAVFSFALTTLLFLSEYDHYEKLKKVNLVKIETYKKSLQDFTLDQQRLDFERAQYDSAKNLMDMAKDENEVIVDEFYNLIKQEKPQMTSLEFIQLRNIFSEIFNDIRIEQRLLEDEELEAQKREDLIKNFLNTSGYYHKNTTMRLRLDEEKLEEKLTEIFCPKCGTKFGVEQKQLGKNTGFVSGAVAGGILGGKIGIVAGPLGGISGAIPGMILGGIFGKAAGNQFDKPKCPSCHHEFTF